MIQFYETDIFIFIESQRIDIKMLTVFLGSKIVLMILSFLCVCVCSEFSAVACAL